MPRPIDILLNRINTTLCRLLVTVDDAFYGPCKWPVFVFNVAAVKCPHSGSDLRRLLRQNRAYIAKLVGAR